MMLKRVSSHMTCHMIATSPMNIYSNNVEVAILAKSLD